MVSSWYGWFLMLIKIFFRLPIRRHVFGGCIWSYSGLRDIWNFYYLLIPHPKCLWLIQGRYHLWLQCNSRSEFLFLEMFFLSFISSNTCWCFCSYLIPTLNTYVIGILWTLALLRSIYLWHFGILLKARFLFSFFTETKSKARITSCIHSRESSPTQQLVYVKIVSPTMLIIPWMYHEWLL